ncbi:MAG: 2OG-Fe(II) oxygenase, partial [Bacteroidota bacterium]
YREAFLPKIESEVEKHRIFNRLGLVEFSKKRFELQVTNYSDGEYFGRHTDNSLSQTQNRKISFVYYLRRQRDCYSGGELVLYDWRSRSSKLAAKSHTRILPYENSIVFFVSSDVHEVLPTFVESGCREDGRFSINGWIVNDSGRVQ